MLVQFHGNQKGTFHLHRYPTVQKTDALYTHAQKSDTFPFFHSRYPLCPSLDSRRLMKIGKHFDSYDAFMTALKAFEDSNITWCSVIIPERPPRKTSSLQDKLRMDWHKVSGCTYRARVYRTLGLRSFSRGIN